MWSALAAKVKLNLMWQEDEEHSLAHDENNDQMLAKWIPLMATSNEWEDIEPAHFVRMPQKKKRQKKKLNVRSPDADPSYVFLGAKFVGRNERAGGRRAWCPPAHQRLVRDDESNLIIIWHWRCTGWRMLGRRSPICWFALTTF